MKIAKQYQTLKGYGKRQQDDRAARLIAQRDLRGDVRGIGMLWAIEFVKDKEPKEHRVNDSAFIQRIKKETERAKGITTGSQITCVSPWFNPSLRRRGWGCGHGGRRTGAEAGRAGYGMSGRSDGSLSSRAGCPFRLMSSSTVNGCVLVSDIRVPPSVSSGHSAARSCEKRASARQIR